MFLWTVRKEHIAFVWKENHYSLSEYPPSSLTQNLTIRLWEKLDRNTNRGFKLRETSIAKFH